MDYPELDDDESIILQSRNVKFKSLSYDALLTGKRIRLTGNKKNTIIPSLDIILATIRNVETEENAIRDHYLTLSVVTDTGEKNKVVLTFAKQAGAERKRECNEWAKKLNSLILPPSPVIVYSVVPALDKEQVKKREVPTPIQESAMGTRPARKKLAITTPSRTIPEQHPGDAGRRETASYLSSPIFCSGCGNRVPADATFCNQCGVPIEVPSGPGHEPQPAESASPVPVSSPASEPVIAQVQGAIQPPSPQPVIVTVQEPVQPSAGPREILHGSSIKQIVPPLQPPLEESVLSTMHYPPPEEQQSSLRLPETSLPVSHAESSPEGVLPVPEAEFSGGSFQKSVPAVPKSPPPLPPPVPAPKGKKPNYRTIGILILAVIPILIGMVIVGNLILGPSGGHANTTPVTTGATPVHTQLTQTIPPSIVLTSPVGWENWERGTSQTITWNYTGNFGSRVKIALLKAGSEVGTIIDSTSTGSDGAGTYSWPIAPSGTTGSDYAVSVQSINQPGIQGVSDNYFSLISATTPADVTPVTDSSRTENSTGVKKGLLNVSIGDYSAELPVFIDNRSAGVVSFSRPLNLTTNVGQHTVRVCVIGLCKNQDVMVLSSNPAEVDFGEWLKKEVVTGPLTVSIGGYDAELPVLVDTVPVGNVTQGEPLNLMASEGNHTVKVCVGILCVNETVEVKFAQPHSIDFGERLKNIAESSTPMVHIVDTRQDGSKVTVDLEFINPSKNDLTFTTIVECAYSYIDPQTNWRKGNAKQITVTRSVKAGTRSKQSSDIWLTGGRSYLIEIPQILTTKYT